MEIGQRRVIFKNGNYVEIKIVELKDIPDMWCDKMHEKAGWKAVDCDGKEYTNNWGSFPSDSMTPYSMWSDGYKDLSVSFGEKHDYELLSKKFPKTVAWCKEHKKFHYKSSNCFDCLMKEATQQKYKTLD